MSTVSRMRSMSRTHSLLATRGVATVNPIFTWVRLAQRIPVRIHIDEAPPGVVLSSGMTASVEIVDRARLAGAANTLAAG
jgi:multidrug resistance efflux pump